MTPKGFMCLRPVGTRDLDLGRTMEIRSHAWILDGFRWKHHWEGQVASSGHYPMGFAMIWWFAGANSRCHTIKTIAEQVFALNLMLLRNIEKPLPMNNIITSWVCSLHGIQGGHCRLLPVDGRRFEWLLAHCYGSHASNGRASSTRTALLRWVFWKTQHWFWSTNYISPYPSELCTDPPGDWDNSSQPDCDAPLPYWMCHFQQWTENMFASSISKFCVVSQVRGVHRMPSTPKPLSK